MNSMVWKIKKDMDKFLSNLTSARKILADGVRNHKGANDLLQANMKKHGEADSMCRSSMAEPAEREQARKNRIEAEHDFPELQSAAKRWQEELPLMQKDLKRVSNEFNRREKIIAEYHARKMQDELDKLFRPIVDFIQEWNEDYQKYRLENGLAINNSPHPITYLLPYEFRKTLIQYLGNLDSLIHYKEYSSEAAEKWKVEQMDRIETAYCNDMDIEKPKTDGDGDGFDFLD